ncbi:MAG: HNH endonuclease domain-containing protein [Ignavibacteria bacterium]|jgi:CRISPR-associated endonuclease Csn1
MQKILGLDLGTNSIGLTIRDTSLDENQFVKYGVTTFKKGVGEGKTGEFSLAAERTKHRSTRRLYQARKYRLWATLEVLIDYNYCPLSKEDLNQWRYYNKVKGYFRKYPIYAVEFEQWIRLDFNNDNKPDYTSPYQLRKELVEKKLDLTNKVDRYKIGRALYHIAQRRGFKSSRKTGDKENTSVYNGSKDSGAKGVNEIKELIEKCGTLGSALASLENNGSRIRNRYTLRKHYVDEVNKILEKQTIPEHSELHTKIHKAIFYQRPLRSQKGLIGKCTLEPNKARCPISHPYFEEFRAWAFLNNIKCKINKDDNWEKLPLEIKEEIYNEKFFKKENHFSFSEINKLISKKGFNWILNYKDKTTVSGCPISARLKSIFGDDWKNHKKGTDKVKKIKRTNGSYKEHKIVYKMEDIWHVLFSFEDEECVIDFAKEKLELNEKQLNDFVSAWNKLQDGYSMLSLNAIKKIIPFLRKGLIYTEAVLLANMPEVLGKEVWTKSEDNLTSCIGDLIDKNRNEKKLLNIVNGLISKWYANDFKVGFKDPHYTLDDQDKQSILKAIISAFGEKTWENIYNKEYIIEKMNFLYQAFFKNDFEWVYIKDEKYYRIEYKGETFYKNIGNGYYKIPHLLDYIKEYLKETYKASEKKLDKLYHPSQINIYPKSKPNKEGRILLQSPKTGSFKNPMAMRTLYELRKIINYLISTDEIDEETEVVVEISRELNDANKRWAIATYQKRREEENQEFEMAIIELLNDPEFTGKIKANPQSSDDINKFRVWYEQVEYKNAFKREPSKSKINKDGNEQESNDPRKYDWNNIRSDIVLKALNETDMIKKYRLWKEQQCRCIYTGNTINLSDLFDENVIDFEHTIPRSISFDNSLANLTVCFADYNRNIKKNRIPTALENYESDSNGYTAIKPRLETWDKRIEEIKNNIEYWKKKSKKAPDKDEKDKAIRQRHLWQFELDYWENKLSRFTMTEVKSGFKNSQLIDTQIISKYAFHYLKSVFNKVSVQKGSTTAEFRKIYGIQPKDEVKNRDKHSHHAIDAAVLTLIPSSAKREEILQESYEHYEKWKLGKLTQKADKQYHIKPYPNFNMSHLTQIENNLLINNITKDNALVPAKKIARKRGKIIYQRDKNGKIIFDENGNKKIKILTGDSIRGELHKDTFLGAIKKLVRDENDNPRIGDDGKFIVENNLSFVVRKPLIYKKDANSPGFNSLKEIKNSIVDPHLFKMIEKQVGKKSLKDALSEEIWMINSQGEKVNRIRHIRVFVREKEPLTIKEQTYLSKKYEYKHYYYAANATSYLYALYEDENGNRGFRSLNLFQASELRRELDIKRDEDFFEPTVCVGRTKKEVPLAIILKPGLKTIFYQNQKDELLELRNSELSNRMYFIKNLFDAQTGRIQFQHHLDSRSDKKLSEAFPKEKYGQRGKNGFSEINFEKPWPRLLLSPINFNFIIEGRDFEIQPDGEINLFKHLAD